jgi:SOS-response transcriptional repressor LexA
VLNLTDKKERKMSMNATKQGIEMRAKIKQAIISYMEKHGYAPTIREIGDMVGLSSTSSVHNHLMRMIDNGELETDDKVGSPRAIRVPGYKLMKN